MLVRLISFVLLVSALARGAETQENGGICCEKDSPRAVRIGSKRYSCGFPSSTMSYTFNPSASGSDLMTCACSKPQNCSADPEEEQDFAFVSLVKQQTLPLSKINDEICDTGDDEPATSACAGVSSSGYYYCSGGIPILFPLSRVGDGVVDCCDCTDEPSVTTCDLSECRRQREAMEREERERREIIAYGLAKLQEISKGTKERLESMKREATEFKSFLDNLASTKKEAEDRLAKEEEAERTGRNARRKAAIDELVTTLSDALQSSPVDDIAKLAAQVAIDNGEAAILALKDSGTFDKDVFDDKLRSIAQNTTASRDEKIDALAEAIKLHKFDRKLLLNVLLSHNDGASHRRITDLAKDILAEKLTPDIDEAISNGNQKLTEQYSRPEAAEARRQMNDIKARESEYKNKLSQNEKTLKFDLGVNSTLLHLVGKVFTIKSGEYTFKFQPFERCEQGNTDIGKYASWSAAAGEEIPQEISEGKGVPKPTMVMNFENGLRCYQGTIRSTKVYLRCGAEDAILKVVEPEICRYVMLFSTPVACVDEKEVLIATETVLASLWRKARSILPW